MTQIIAALTNEYAFLVSDRLLTYGNGPKAGKVFKEQECKLVSLCNSAVIGYTGLARIGGMPTHEWIATTLAKAACQHPGAAADTLLKNTNAALPNLASPLRRQAFLLAGWAPFEPVGEIRPHVCLVSNFHDESLNQTADSASDFRLRLRVLQESENAFVFSIGQPLQQSRELNLVRHLNRLIARQIGPKEMLRLLVEEVFFTSTLSGTVGDRVLACCIPRHNAQQYFSEGQSRLSGMLPRSDRATFSYFDRRYNEHSQYGPTIVCGSQAFTDLRYTKEKNGPAQSVSWRVLYAHEAET